MPKIEIWAYLEAKPHIASGLPQSSSWGVLLYYRTPGWVFLMEGMFDCCMLLGLLSEPEYIVFFFFDKRRGQEHARTTHTSLSSFFSPLVLVASSSLVALSIICCLIH